jgi:hypothetical protein
MKIHFILIIALFFSFCTDTKKQTQQTNIPQTTAVAELKNEPLFSLVPSDQSGVDFTNFNK